MKPSLGLLVVGYQHRRYIDAYMYRLRPQLAQFDQVLMIDNGGTDGSADELRKAGVGDVLHREDSVLPTAMNEGMSRLQTDYVIPSSLDDLLKPEAGTKLRHALSRVSRDVAAVWGQADVIDDMGNLISTAPTAPFRTWPAPLFGLLALAGFAAPAFNGFLIKRPVAVELRYRDEDWAEDFGMTLRLALRYPVAISGLVWADYRRHGASWSVDAGRMFEVSSSSTRFRIVNELWPNPGPMRSLGLALAAYGASRWSNGRNDWRDTVRFALESLAAAPWVPLGLHTLARALQAAGRGA